MDAWLQEFHDKYDQFEREDRTFPLLGESLTVKPVVSARVGTRFNSFRRQLGKQVEAAKEAEEAAKKAEKNGAEKTVASPSGLLIDDEQMLAMAEGTIRACLEHDSWPAWERLMDPEAEKPLSFAQVFDICDYVIGRASGLPTVEPSGSSDGQQNEKDSSTDESPLTVEALPV